MSSLRIDLEPLHGANEPGPGPEGAGGRDRRGSSGRGHTGVGRWLRRATLAVILAPAAFILPLLLLVRGSMELHSATDLGVASSLAGGAAMALAALALLIALISALIGLPGGLRRFLMRAGAVVALGWGGFGLLTVAATNVKSGSVAQEYRSLHPFLRLASATLFLIDRESVLTDAARTMEDYEAMGLPANERSLHFEQDDGWVHALDLRTVGRPEWRNAAVARGFEVMGFSTLRHVGTADHLHISLPR